MDGFTRATVARVRSVHYKGKMWCISVPTHAFVARRHGKVFVTGNSGYPKGLNVSKAIDKALGAERESVPNPLASKQTAAVGTNDYGDFGGASLIQPEPVTDEAREWDGWFSQIKPAYEPVLMAQKPLDGTIAHNVLTHGCGALNVDACRVPVEPHDPSRDGERSATKSYRENGVTDWESVPGPRGGDPKGRFPANLVHDGSDEVLALFPDSKGQLAKVSEGTPRGDAICYGKYGPRGEFPTRGDSGSAARFFYCAKASREDRNLGGVENRHVAVKPNALMRWLVRLVCRKGGLVLDPFMGSGSTGVACIDEGMDFIGIEASKEYCDIAEARMKGAVERNAQMALF